MSENLVNVLNPKKINIAIIGLGKISKNHIISILELRNYCTLAAICDISSENLNSTQSYINNFTGENINYLQPKAYLSLDDLLNDYKNNLIKLDLVVLCTPSGMHPFQTSLCSEQGVNVCTEKPMATNWRDALKMVNECKRNNVKLFIIKQMRLYPSVQLVKKQIDKQRFGRLALVNVNIFWNRSQSYYDEGEWRGSVDLDGGALMNQAIHFVDLTRWFLGDASTVDASLATIARNIDTEDTAVVNIKWPNNALGNIALTMLSLPGNIENNITIIGEKGSVKLGGKTFKEIKHWFFKDADSDDDLIDNPSWTSEASHIGHKRYYKNMIKALIDGTSSICLPDDALKTFELLIASHLSHEKNHTISLPLSETDSL